MTNEFSTASDVRLEIDPKNGNRLTIQFPGGEVNQYDFSFHACPSPTCWCYSVDLVCTLLGDPKAGDSGPRIVALDIHEQGPQKPLRNTEQIDLPLTRVVAAGLTSEHWRHLRAWLTAEKRRIMEDMDLDSLAPNFPSDVTTDGRMIGYEEIFPFAEPLIFSVDEQPWVVDDQYCVQPECNCNEVFFCVLPLSGADVMGNEQQYDPVDKSARVVAAIRYDIRQRSWQAVDDPPVSPATVRMLMIALEEEFPDFHAAVAERRRQLRHLYRRWIERNAEPRSTPVVAAPKIGRNLPCPCGSGKKYKRCCGR